LEAAAQAGLEAARLDHNGVQVSGTPRRLVVQVRRLAAVQPDDVSRMKGPPAERAFDDDGNLTQAGEGFARSKGLSADDLEIEELDGGRYVVALVREEGRPAADVLAEDLPNWLASLSFARDMRWNASGSSFSRPIRWLLALHGEHVIPFSYAGVHSGRVTRGLRLEDPPTVEIQDASSYAQSMSQRGILLDPLARREQIAEQVASLAAEVGGKPIDDPSLLVEVGNLVEVPTALRGSFDESYLDLPRTILITVMRKHQRYFAIEADGQLMPYFITVRNGGDQHLDIVRQGNEQVLRARFADAAYFFERDLSRPLEDYRSQLDTMTFESSLGSMLDKSERIERLVRELAVDLELSPADIQAAERAAHLAKADLATQMVVEMTSLQGEMGRIYALRSDEDDVVAAAIAEHYLPRFSGDRLPESSVGLAVALADRLDSLVGLFAAGKAPTGGGDPFALRRTAIGLIEILVHDQQHVDMKRLLELAAAEQPIAVDDDVLTACLEFIRRRQQALLLADGHRHDAVESVLAEQAGNPAGAANAVVDLERWMAKPEWERLLQNYARCVRITRDLEQRFSLAPSAFDEPAAQRLQEAYQQARQELSTEGSIEELLSAIERMVPQIEEFFEDVLVMAEDEKVRRNRLALLQSIAAMAQGTADMSYLEGF
ncbi:MAG: glycine--tRNA ligase subunit beta, partial [Anaerolineales bacterium]